MNSMNKGKAKRPEVPDDWRRVRPGSGCRMGAAGDKLGKASRATFRRALTARVNNSTFVYTVGDLQPSWCFLSRRMIYKYELVRVIRYFLVCPLKCRCSSLRIGRSTIPWTRYKTSSSFFLKESNSL